MRPAVRLPLVFASALLALACSKDPAPGQADFARGGVPDDGVKPVARAGVPDDGVKPVAPLVKPAPTPIPTFTAARVGTIDDGVKPLPKIAPAPAPTPR